MSKLITPNSPTTNSASSMPFCNRPAVSRFHLKAEQARRDFHEFVKQAWHVLEPGTPFVDGMPMQAICAHLQAITEGRLAHLIINVPPGHAKSLLTAVFWPAWWWIREPRIRFLFASYSAILSERDSVRCR